MSMQDIRRLLLFALPVLLFASCSKSKDPNYNTDHPEHGKITVTADWSGIGQDITKPSAFTVAVGGHTVEVTGDSHAIDKHFDPGDYLLYAYNKAGNITVSGTTATADYTTGTPEWFFTCSMDVKVEADKVHAVTAVMKRQVREVTLIIELTGGTADRIEGITATLSGVAGTLNIDNYTHGSPSNVDFAFTKITTGADAGKWTTTVRLLGVTGSEQKLTGTIRFTGGIPGDMPLQSDLSADLANFNANKTEPFALGGTVAETPTGTGFTATITGWNPVPGSSVIAN